MNCHQSAHCWDLEAGFSMERILGRTKLDRTRKDRTKEDRTKLARPEKDRTKKVDYAMPTDFCRVFDDHLDDLYTLSFLLTANRDKADQCFVSGLEDCLQGNTVFREWAQSWAKRTVIKNAIRLISPSTIAPLTTSPLRNETATATGIPESLSEVGTPVAAITSLQPFDRFVFVLSVLEKYSDKECSMLLDCPVDKIIDARIRALQRLASVSSPKDPAEPALTSGAA